MSKTNKKQEVFCSDCRYVGVYNEERCRHPKHTFVRYKITPQRKIQLNTYLNTTNEINFNNDCPDYLDHECIEFLFLNGWKSILGLVKAVIETEFLNQE